VRYAGGGQRARRHRSRTSSDIDVPDGMRVDPATCTGAVPRPQGRLELGRRSGQSFLWPELMEELAGRRATLRTRVSRIRDERVSFRVHADHHRTDVRQEETLPGKRDHAPRLVSRQIGVRDDAALRMALAAARSGSNWTRSSIWKLMGCGVAPGWTDIKGPATRPLPGCRSRPLQPLLIRPGHWWHHETLRLLPPEHC
jgi:hypothetical protein